jgi:flagellar biosynthesis/type III secretory pathway protein FliH
MAAVLTVTGAGIVVAKSDHPPPKSMGVVESPKGPDPRISLNLDPRMQELLKQTMREHLEAIQAIIAALAQENYKKASAVAHEDLGFLKHHQVMQREQGATFPKKYQDLAMAHHQAAEALARAIPAKVMKPILQELDHTLRACLDCHRVYKL